MTANVIIPELKKNAFYKALRRVLNHPKLTLFHDCVRSTMYEMEFTSQSNLIEINSKKGYNQLFINNSYYAMENEVNSFTIKSGKLDNVEENNQNLVMEIISNVQKDFETNTKSTKYIKFYKEFFEYDNAKYFLHDYLSYAVIVSARYTYKNSFKLTNLSINICETILRFIIAQIPLLKIIEKCFNLQESQELSTLQIDKILLFSKLVLTCTIDDPEFITIFKEFDIKSKVIQENIVYYFYTQFYNQYEKNTIYIAKLRDLIRNSYNIENTIKNMNLYKQHCLTTGYFLLDAFIYREMFTITTHIRYKKPCKYIVIAPKVVKELVRTPKHEKPFLDQKQLFISHKPKNDRNNYEKIIYENLSTFIHDNPRIKIKLKAKCYLHNKKLFTKFSIDIDYLTRFLNLLCDGIKQEYLFSLFNIKISKLTHLSQQHHSLSILIDHIISWASDFTQNFTTSEINSLVKKTFEKMIKEVWDNPEFTENLKLEVISSIRNIKKEYITIITDIVNIVFQRKLFLINLINESIDYSVYKFFIYSAYLDSRSRIYDASTALNINNNPIAKLFVKLYDENEGDDITNRELPIIKSCLIHKQTQEKIHDLVNVDLRNENITEIHKYIINYLNINYSKFIDLIENPIYYNNTKLLEFLYINIKKPKHLFYVHSLINYEQLRYRDTNIKHFCNYYQKDASSSGLQMMSILFRNPKLTEISNLSGNNNYDIYAKATQHVYDTFTKFHTLSFLGCIWFDRGYISFIDLSYKTYYERIDFENDSLSIRIFINIDFGTSSISRDLINHLINIMKNPEERYNHNNELIPYPIIKSCQELLTYLPTSYIKLINEFSALDDFKDNKDIIEYLFCFRYATRLLIISDMILGINSLWFDRELTKNHVMTLVYMSTSYGRKQHYIELLKDVCMAGYSREKFCKELAAFFDTTTTKFLEKLPILQLIYDFVDNICNDKKIVIINRNFEISFNPQITKDFQVSCSSFKKDKRAPQLVIKKLTTKLDKVKLRSMFMANLAHTMDSDLMHHFIELCLDINKKLAENKSKSRLCFQRNHDCFILNFAPLLPILIEEAYLRLSSQNNIAYISGISDELIEKFTTLDCDKFVSILSPINPNFIK